MAKKFIAIFFILLANISLLANSMTFHYHDTIENCMSHVDEVHDEESHSSPVFFLDHEHDEEEHDSSQHCHEFENQNTYFLHHNQSNFKKQIQVKFVNIFHNVLTEILVKPQYEKCANYKPPVLIKSLIIKEIYALRGPPTV